MINIAICDDEQLNINILTDLLTGYSTSKSVSFLVHKYINGLNLLKQLESHQKYDIIFLDIEMESIDGITLAEKIREHDMKVPIVYITNYQDYWKKAYKVHAFQFMVKPIKKEELFKTLDDFFKLYTEINESKVQLNCDSTTMLVTQSEIYYFYILKKKKVHMKTVDGSYFINENLSDILNKLNPDDFYVSHKSCIINLRYIKSIEN